MPSKRKPAAPRPRMTTAQFNKLMADRLEMAMAMGMKAEKIGPGAARLRLAFDSRHVRPGGTIAGPVQMALADVALYAVVLSLLGPVEMAVTASLTINFLRRPKPADLIAEAKILKLGKRLAVGECAIYTKGEDDMVAHVTGTYSIPPS